MALAQFAKPAASAGDLEQSIAVQIQLMQPPTGHNGPVQAINLREPTMGDYVDCGPLTRQIAHDPRVVNDMSIEIVPDYSALMKWMVRLSGVSESVLRQLKGRDGAAVKVEVEKLVAEFERGNSPSAQ